MTTTAFVSLCKSCQFNCKGPLFVDYCSSYRYKKPVIPDMQMSIFDVLKPDTESSLDKMSSKA